MMRPLTFLLLFVSFIASAAQIQATSPPRDLVKTGTYAGKVNEENGSRSADVKMIIKFVSADGRTIQGRVTSSHARKSCGQSLPLNGMTLPDGNLRLTVDDGAPEGCERIYNVKLSDGAISGTFLDSTKPVTKKKAAPAQK